MAEEEKPQQDEAALPAVKKTTKKKASAKKRAAAKKKAVKPRTTKKTAAKKIPPPIDAATVEVTLQKVATGGTPRPTTARHVWWRVAIMVAIVVVIFSYIRNAAHEDASSLGTDKAIAPSPWAGDAPMQEMAQPHPWELAPLPEGGGDFGTQQPYAPQTQQAYPKLEPWQSPESATGQKSQPYYPPPPGYYGYPPAPVTESPYQR